MYVYMYLHIALAGQVVCKPQDPSRRGCVSVLLPVVCYCCCPLLCWFSMLELSVV